MYSLTDLVSPLYFVRRNPHSASAKEDGDGRTGGGTEKVREFKQV
jgi:hypothetical protein